jgi:hypothetical protein
LSTEDLKGIVSNIDLYKKVICTIEKHQKSFGNACTKEIIDEIFCADECELKEDLLSELEGVGEENEYDYSDEWLVKDDEVVEEETPSPKKKRTRPEVDELDVAQYVLKYKKYRKLVAKHRPEIIEQN